jgi:hypothetical protein
MLAESRSAAVELAPAEAEGVAALQAALDALTDALKPSLPPPQRSAFDLRRYERHVEAHCRHGPLSLAEIPSLIEDARRDLVYRFIALMFLAHAGTVRVWQEGRDILVIHREADPKGQGVP